jgi:hypothetical protein
MDAGVVRWSRTGSGPEKPALAFGKGNIVNARFAAAYEAEFVELPQPIAITALPDSDTSLPSQD